MIEDAAALSQVEKSVSLSLSRDSLRSAILVPEIHRLKFDRSIDFQSIGDPPIERTGASLTIIVVFFFVRNE